jgi:hypothetical protein
MTVSGRAFSRSARKQPDQARVASMPDTAWPVGGHPPGLSRDSRYIPVSMSPVFVSTRHQRFACARLPDPYLTHQVRLFPHRSPRQASTNAAVGGLEPPPAGRPRRAYLHLPCNIASRSSTYLKLPSAFGTQVTIHPPATNSGATTSGAATGDYNAATPTNSAASTATPHHPRHPQTSSDPHPHHQRFLPQ